MYNNEQTFTISVSVPQSRLLTVFTGPWLGNGLTLSRHLNVGAKFIVFPCDAVESLPAQSSYAVATA